jgi:hypothetical protein
LGHLDARAPLSGSDCHGGAQPALRRRGRWALARPARVGLAGAQVREPRCLDRLVPDPSVATPGADCQQQSLPDLAGLAGEEPGLAHSGAQPDSTERGLAGRPRTWAAAVRDLHRPCTVCRHLLSRGKLDRVGPHPRLCQVKHDLHRARYAQTHLGVPLAPPGAIDSVDRRSPPAATPSGGQDDDAERHRCVLVV